MKHLYNVIIHLYVSHALYHFHSLVFMNKQNADAEDKKDKLIAHPKVEKRRRVFPFKRPDIIDFQNTRN